MPNDPDHHFSGEEPVAAGGRASKKSSDKPSAQAVAVQRALDILMTAAERSPSVVNAEEKLKIANIAAQQLHITTADQMREFCKTFWICLRDMAKLGTIAAVTPSKAPGTRVRLGPTSILTAAAEEAGTP